MRRSTARSASATAAAASVVLPHVVHRHRHSKEAFAAFAMPQLLSSADCAECLACHVPNTTPAHGLGLPARPEGSGEAAAALLLPADEAEEAVEEEEEVEADEDAEAAVEEAEAVAAHASSPLARFT